VVVVDEAMTVEMCYRLLREHMIFAGGSSGSVMAAIIRYFKNKSFSVKPNVLTVFPDRGDRYINTIYNKEWVKSTIKQII
jgi:cysteine synthase